MGLTGGPESGGLRRTVDLRTVISTSAGLTFASSTFLVVVFVGYSLAGDAAWIPILIAGLLCALAAAAFSELNGLFPSAAGVQLYIHRAFGEKAALLVSLTYMSVVTLVVGTEAYVLSHVLSAAVPTIAPPVWIFVMLTAATGANFRGLRVAGALQDIITYSVVVSIIVMSVWALARVHFAVPSPLHAGSVTGVATAVGFAVFLFVGYEWVTPLAEEVRDPRSIARGMLIAIALLTAVYSLVAVAMFATTKRHLLYGTESKRQPIPHLVFAAHALGPAGRWLMIVTSLCMSLTTFNAGLIGVSRFIYASARANVLPKWLSHASERFSTPDRAVFAVYVIALIISFVVYVTGQYVLLVNLAAATECFVYAWAAACVISLRRRDPARSRPFRMWGGIWLPTLVGGLFCAFGAAVFVQPGWETWGAGILLAAVAGGWWLYILRVVMPRKEKLRAEQEARRRKRSSPGAES